MSLDDALVLHPESRTASSPVDARQFVSASIVLGRALMDLDTNDERKSRKRRVLQRRLALLQETLAEAERVTDLHRLRPAMPNTREEAATVIVEMAFSVPFAPYELEFTESDFDKALRATGSEMDFPHAYVDRVLALKREAAGAHARAFAFFTSPWSLVIAGVLATAALPFLPALIGGGGLAGVAATSHGLALLGGGSLAVGGFGMAGGTWVLAGLGTAAVATAATGIGAGMKQMIQDAPLETIRLEVAKCQATTVLRMENGSLPRTVVAERLAGLDDLRRELEKDLTTERELNDPRSHRIRVLKEKIAALGVGRDWIAERLG